MIAQDVAVFSHRYPIKARLELLLGSPLGDGSDWIWPLADAFAGGSRVPRVLIVDVLRLLSAEVAYLPQLTSASPNMLVVGLPDDVDDLVAAWSEGIPARTLDDLGPQTLAKMVARCEDGCEFYDFLGRLCAHSVHGFLARRFEHRVLTDREMEIVQLLRLGWKIGRVASYLGLETQTVKNHSMHIHQKLGISSRYELLARAAESVPETAHRPRPPAAPTGR